MLVELAMSLMFFAFCYEDRIISLLRGEMMNMSMPKEVPFVEIKDRFLLTFHEASAYFGIGLNRLREICKEPSCDFIIQTGERKTMIIRSKMEQYMLEHSFI